MFLMNNVHNNWKNRNFKIVRPRNENAEKNQINKTIKEEYFLVLLKVTYT